MLAASDLICALLRLAASLLGHFALLVIVTALWRAYKVHLPIWLLQRRRATGASARVRPIRANQCVLVTGATSGIGLALSRYLHARGYTVIGAYLDKNEAGFGELRERANEAIQMNKANQFALVQMDVRDERSIGDARERVERLLEDYGRKFNKTYSLYGLINNAGLGSLQPFAWLQRARIRSLVETNLLGTMLVAREFIPLLASRRNRSNDDADDDRQRSARLLITSSGLGLVPGATYATYGATKAAQIYLAQCLNAELRRSYAIDCVAVIPHNFIKNTNICAANAETSRAAWHELRPTERLLYETEFRAHNKQAEALRAATEAHVKRLEADAGADASTAQQQPKNSKRASIVAEIARRLVGENSAPTLEQSGALEQFEWALRLDSVPEHMFAGDTIYDLVVGSLLLSLPISFAGLLGVAVAPSLYK